MMNDAHVFPAGNRIVDAARTADTALFPHAAVVTLDRAQVTTVQGNVMTTVDFPVTALLSVFALLENGSTAEVASMGSEGFVELDAALRSDVAKRTSICLFPGEVIRVPIAEFQRAIRENDAFATHVFHSVRARTFMSEQLAICGLRHTAGERLARWLLLASNRTQSGALSQTHEQLASVLGIRRSSVTVEAGALQALGAISYARGLVKIEDRAALAARACECYVLCEHALSEA
jgi:CRP-like cAMP-binding protein